MMIPGARPVLLIDDDELIVQLVGELLSDEGYPSILAHSVTEALDHADHTLPGVIVTDTFGQHDADRRAVLARLRATWPTVPLILCSAWDGLDQVSPEDLGVFAIVPKPFELDHLLAVIRAAMEAGADPPLE